MSWFKRKEKNIVDGQKKDLPDNLWKKCSCGEILYIPELEINLSICHHCGFHFPYHLNDYISILFDTNPRRICSNISSTDLLNFKANKAYQEILDSSDKSSEAIESYFGEIDSKEVVVALMNFKFIGGSMGSAVGEILKQSIIYAKGKKCPLIILCQSGGARMQEGAMSLMQLAKVSAYLKQFSDSGGLYISVLTYPTTGGVTASFGMQADITFAEPKSLIGFAGQRVIKQTTQQDLPEGFQTAEFLLEKGFIDQVVDRKNLKKQLSKTIALLS